MNDRADEDETDLMDALTESARTLTGIPSCPLFIF